MNNKTQSTNESVIDFLANIKNEKQRNDSIKINQFLMDIVHDQPKIWGTSIIGYGEYHYKYKSGREGDWFLLGFSPKKVYTSLYVYQNTANNKILLQELGIFKMGKSCINIRHIEDQKLSVLKEICLNSIQFLKEIYQNEKN